MTTHMPTTQVASFGDRRRASAAPQGAGDISPWELLRGIWARKELVAITFACFMALAILWLIMVTPTYTVESRVLLVPRTGEISNFDLPITQPPPDSESIQSEIQVLTSRPLLVRLVRDMKLVNDPEFNPALRGGFKSSLLSFMRVERSAPTETEIANALLGKLGVYQKGTSRVLAIEFTSTSARTAAALANRLAELYIAQQVEQTRKINHEALEWLGTQIEELRKKVQASEAAVESFRSDSGLFLTNGSTVPQQQLTDINAQLTVAEAARAEADANVANVKSLIVSGSANSAAAVLQSPLIQNLRQQEVALKAQIAQMSETLLPSHPRMMEAQANLTDLQGQIEKEVDKVLQGLQNQARVAAARVASLRESLSDLQSRMGTVNQDDVKLRALQRDATTNRSLLESFLKRYEEANARTAVDQSTANARIVSRAQILSAPTFPKTGSALTLAIVAGLVLSLVVTFFAEVFSSGFRTAEQVERVTGMPFLGLVPEVSLPLYTGPAGMIQRDPFGVYAEAIRALQSNVLLARIGNRRARTVLITSTYKDEGKTSTAASLARVMSMGGYRTIIIDADLRSPSVHYALGSVPQPGLAELLTSRASFEHVIRQDTGSYAHIIQAGGGLANPSAALASSQMLWILKALEQTYDFVIIDSPPVMAVSDAQVLSKMVDVTVMVVRWADTSRHAVSRALKMLTAASERRVGILLSHVDMNRYRRYTDSAVQEYPGRPVRLT